MVIEAKYENGVFRPLEKIRLEEGTLVEIHVNRGQAAKKTMPFASLVLLKCGLTALISKMELATWTP